MTTSALRFSLLQMCLMGLLVAEWHLQKVFGFSLPRITVNHVLTSTKPASKALQMGLYDDPLPPRPSPREEESGKNEEEEEEEETLAVTQQLFRMQDDGREKQNLLPSIGRRLDMGIGCYFEITDRKVQNLAQQASCNPVDAAWALEACKGDVTEARTLISVAQRMALESIEVELRSTDDEELDEKENDDELILEQVQNKKKEDGGLKLDDVKSDLYDMLREEEWEEMAEQRLKDRTKQKRMDAFKGSGKDAQWLPTNNPRPIDDEPWFTG